MEVYMLVVEGEERTIKTIKWADLIVWWLYGLIEIHGKGESLWIQSSSGASWIPARTVNFIISRAFYISLAF